MKKVLYIDDEADTEKMASRFDLLKEEGIDVLPVTRVEEVLPALEKHQGSIGLVVLDIIMPPEDYYSLEETNHGTMTGLRLLEDIREKYKDLPVLIVSIKRKENAGNILEKYKVVGFVQKPILAAELASIIKKIIG